MDRWDVEVEPYSNDEVDQFVVHDQNWQAFRRSLLHTSTQTKLICMHNRLEDAIKMVSDPQELRRFKVQIDHYLISLRRGGFLDHNFVVKK